LAILSKSVINQYEKEMIFWNAIDVNLPEKKVEKKTAGKDLILKSTIIYRSKQNKFRSS